MRLAVRPAKEPVPALKYHLMPELRELKTGNAALLYYRAFSPDWLHHVRPEVSRRLDEWSTDPKKVPLDEFRWVLTSKAIQELDLAARRTHCDWELTERARKDGYNLLIPDVQGFRSFARVLLLRARIQMTDGKHQDVAHTLQTGFALARHVSDAPTLIQALVGTAIAGLSLQEVERWVQTPGAPNLYWALGQLPQPFIDLRRPLQGERILIDSLLPGARDALAGTADQPFTAAQLEAAIASLSGPVFQEGSRKSGSNVEGRVALAFLAARIYPEARRTLIALGRKPEEVDAMPVLQAVLFYEIHEYDRTYDDMLKWYGAPSWLARPAIERTAKQFGRTARNAASRGGLLARMLLPSIDRVVGTQVRTDRKINALRCVEALRLHAAEHGALPARLDDVKAVPVPDDPATGKPFEYRLDGEKAVLFGAPPAGEKANTGNAIRYEITLTK